MAHFAQVTNNFVTQVIIVDNSDCAGGSFPESELAGQTYIASLGIEGEWLQTSYNNNFRGTYAGIGYTYDADLDEFVAPVVEPD
jgi:hypothetical protein